MACAPFETGAEASLSAGLASLDCHVDAAVALGYGRLFGAGGLFGAALTAVLTIFVAVLAYSLMTGRTRLSLSALTPKALVFGLVLTFATAWPAYQALIYGLLSGGPDELASAFMGGHSGATSAFTGQLDRLFASILDMAQALAADKPSGQLQVAQRLVWTSAITLMLSTVGLLVIARIVLAILLALGPVFIVMALFGPTRGLFEGWLRTTVAFAFAPMLIVLGGSGAMAVLSPLIEDIAQDPAAAVAELRPLVVLCLGALVYAGLLLTAMWTAVSLTRGWRLPLGREPFDAGRHPVEVKGAAASAVAHSLAGGASSHGPGPGADRVSTVVSAVLSQEGRAAAARVQVVHAPADHSPPTPPGAGPRRSEGLGQTFRRPADGRTLSGALGS